MTFFKILKLGMH